MNFFCPLYLITDLLLSLSHYDMQCSYIKPVNIRHTLIIIRQEVRIFKLKFMLKHMVFSSFIKKVDCTNVNIHNQMSERKRQLVGIGTKQIHPIYEYTTQYICIVHI